MQNNIGFRITVELELLKLKFTTDAKPKNKSSTTVHQPY